MINWFPLLDDSHLIQALGWTVVHSLWQGSIIAWVLYLWLSNSKATNNIRYVGSLYAMLSMVLASAITFLYYFGPDTGQDTATLTQSINISLSETLDQAASPGGSISLELLPYVTNIWIIGCLLFSLKIIVAGVYTSFLKRQSYTIEDPVLNEILHRLLSKINVQRPVSIASSLLVKSPVMIGHFKPVILLPIALLNQLTLEEVESILAHEIAHIQRNDYLVNILQLVTEVIYYYHPAIYYISEQVRAEREHCCDEVAIAHSQSSTDYAKLLVKLQELQIKAMPSLAMNITQPNQVFMNRIKRLLKLPATTKQHKSKPIFIILIALMLIGFQEHAHSISNLVSDRLVSPISSLTSTHNQPLTSMSHSMISVDTTPIIKKIVTTKTITVINGDSTISETIHETEGAESLDENVIIYMNDEKEGGKKKVRIEIDGNKHRWFDIGNNTMGMDTLIFPEMDLEHEISIMIDSLEDGLSNLEIMLGEGGHMQLRLDTLINSHHIDVEKLLGTWTHLFPPNGDSQIFKFDTDEEDIEILLEDLEDFKGEFPEDLFKDRGNFWMGSGSMKPSDKLANELNQDGLLELNEDNKVELSGKDLKINGDKQPKNIHSKYKRLWEESTGLTMEKKDKISLNIIGKEVKRQVHRF